MINQIGISTIEEQAQANAITSINGQLPVSGNFELTFDNISGVVPSTALPSYVDEIIELNSTGNFPIPGETSKIYLITGNVLEKNYSYRWGGNSYVNIGMDPEATTVELNRKRPFQYRLNTILVPGGTNEITLAPENLTWIYNEVSIPCFSSPNDVLKVNIPRVAVPGYKDGYEFLFKASPSSPSNPNCFFPTIEFYGPTSATLITSRPGGSPYSSFLYRFYFSEGTWSLLPLETNQENTTKKNTPGGYVGLDSNSLINNSYLPLASDSNRGAMSPSDKLKLDNIQTGVGLIYNNISVLTGLHSMASYPQDLYAISNLQYNSIILPQNLPNASLTQINVNINHESGIVSVFQSPQAFPSYPFDVSVTPGSNFFGRYIYYTGIGWKKFGNIPHKEDHAFGGSDYISPKSINAVEINSSYYISGKLLLDIGGSASSAAGNYTQVGTFGFKPYYRKDSSDTFAIYWNTGINAWRIGLSPVGMGSPVVFATSYSNVNTPDLATGWFGSAPVQSLSKLKNINITEQQINGDLYIDNVYAKNLIYNTGQQNIDGIKVFKQRAYLASGFQTYPFVVKPEIDFISQSIASTELNFKYGELSGSLVKSAEYGGRNIYTGFNNNIHWNLVYEPEVVSWLFLSGSALPLSLPNVIGSNESDFIFDPILLNTGNWLTYMQVPMLPLTFSKVEVAAESISPISITYSDLKTLKDSSLLKTGQKYIINDFQLRWQFKLADGNWSSFSSNVIEPLIVHAVASNKIAHEAYSTLHPEDIVYYDFEATKSYTWSADAENGPNINNFKGWIYRRIDNLNKIDIGWDWRYITNYCSKPDFNSLPSWDASTYYSSLDVVMRNNNLYYSKKNNNFNEIPDGSGVTSWSKIAVDANIFYPIKVINNQNACFSIYLGLRTPIVIPADINTAIQQPTFIQDLKSQSNLFLDGVKNISIGYGYQNVIRCSTQENAARNINILGSFFNNAIENSFSYNDSRGDFTDNCIGQSFNGNRLPDIFNFNIISDSCYNNEFGSEFTTNNVGENFIGNNFSTVGRTLDSVIGKDFAYNQTNSLIFACLINNNFISNTVSADLQNYNLLSASTVYSNFNKEIKTNSSGQIRLIYLNSSDQIVVTDINN